MIEIGFNGSMVGNLKSAAAYNGLFKEDEGGTEIITLNFTLNIGYMDKLQLSVERSNEASVKTITKNGGKYERSFSFEGEEADVYMIHVV